MPKVQKVNPSWGEASAEDSSGSKRKPVSPTKVVHVGRHSLKELAPASEEVKQRLFLQELPAEMTKTIADHLNYLDQRNLRLTSPHFYKVVDPPPRDQLVRAHKDFVNKNTNVSAKRKVEAIGFFNKSINEDIIKYYKKPNQAESESFFKLCHNLFEACGPYLSRSLHGEQVSIGLNKGKIDINEIDELLRDSINILVSNDSKDYQLTAAKVKIRFILSDFMMGIRNYHPECGPKMFKELIASASTDEQQMMDCVDVSGSGIVSQLLRGSQFSEIDLNMLHDLMAAGVNGNHILLIISYSGKVDADLLKEHANKIIEEDKKSPSDIASRISFRDNLLENSRHILESYSKPRESE